MKINFEFHQNFPTSVRISTKSITKFEASRSTELKLRHHRCSGSMLLMQGSPEQMGKKDSFVKLARHALPSNQRDTLRISWNICKLVVIKVFQNVKSTFCTVSREFKLGIVYQFPAKTTTKEQFPKSTCCIRVFCHNITELWC